MPYSYDLPSVLNPGIWTLTFDDEFELTRAAQHSQGGPFRNSFMTVALPHSSATSVGLARLISHLFRILPYHL